MRLPALVVGIYALRHTPIGMCMEEVTSVIEGNEMWGSPVGNRGNGFLHPAFFIDRPDGSRARAVIDAQSVQDTHIAELQIRLVLLFSDK
jgi:hypothetical protein